MEVGLSAAPNGTDEHHVHCPDCNRAFLVQALDVAVLPFCGCYGVDWGASRVPCAACATRHILACPATTDVPPFVNTK